VSFAGQESSDFHWADLDDDADWQLANKNSQMAESMFFSLKYVVLIPSLTSECNSQCKNA